MWRKESAWIQVSFDPSWNFPVFYMPILQKNLPSSMFANSTSSASWPISISDFFQFRLWIFCQLNPTAFLLFCALSRVCWVPVQCQFWNTDFLPGSVGQMLLCQVFLFCFVFCGFLPLYLQWPMVSIMFWCPLMQSATCPTVPWLTSLCSNVFVIVLFGLEVPYRKLVTLFIFDYWEKSHKSLNPKEKNTSCNFFSGFLCF